MAIVIFIDRNCAYWIDQFGQSSAVHSYRPSRDFFQNLEMHNKSGVKIMIDTGGTVDNTDNTCLVVIVYNIFLGKSLWKKPPCKPEKWVPMRL